LRFRSLRSSSTALPSSKRRAFRSFESERDE
jgi:hypothetical protein